MKQIKVQFDPRPNFSSSSTGLFGAPARWYLLKVFICKIDASTLRGREECYRCKMKNIICLLWMLCSKKKCKNWARDANQLLVFARWSPSPTNLTASLQSWPPLETIKIGDNVLEREIKWSNYFTAGSGEPVERMCIQKQDDSWLAAMIWSLPIWSNLFQ